MSNLKEKLKNGGIVLGTWSSIPSASLVNVLSLSGIDFIIIDTEHGPVSIEKAEDLVRAAQASNVPALIRVQKNDPSLILRALDIGSDGVHIPHVGTPKDALDVVQACKYYPLGMRGLSPFTRAGDYGLGAKDHTQRCNDYTLIAVHIEGKEGLKNLPEIVKIKGVDVVFIGPYDLSQSLGKPGQIKDPNVLQSIRESVAIIRKQNLVCGSFAQDFEMLEILIDYGVQYISYSVDSAMIVKTYKDLSTKFQMIKKMY